MTTKTLFFDCETTGVSAETDRIIEIAFVDENHKENTERFARWLLNPGIPIPSSATAIHGYTDEMVKDKPLFRDVAKDILDLINGVNLAGFGITQFDMQILSAEFDRAGLIWDHKGLVIDYGVIYKKLNPRTLESAMRSYAPEVDFKAHSALSDAIGVSVLAKKMRLKHQEIGEFGGPELSAQNLARLSQYGDMPYIDIAGKLVRDTDGDAVFNFSKHKGTKVRNETGFAYWMLGKDFPSETLRRLKEELSRIENDGPCLFDATDDGMTF